MFSCVYVCVFLHCWDLYICLLGCLSGPQLSVTGGSLRFNNRPCGRPVEHLRYPPGSDAFEVRPPATLHLQCAESVEGRNPESIPDTNMEKSLFGVNIRANIILPERNHGEHL